MKRLYLEAEEKEALEQRHRDCVNRKEGDRIKAILLRSEGWTVQSSTSPSSNDHY